MRRFLLAAAFFLILIISGVVYCVSLFFSEGVSYSKGSIEYLILTPEVIANLPIVSSTEARYRYSSADGPKPVTNVVELTTNQDLSAVKAQVREYLTSVGFVETTPGDFRRGDTEVLVEYTPVGAQGVKIELANLDYIKY